MSTDARKRRFRQVHRVLRRAVACAAADMLNRLPRQAARACGRLIGRVFFVTMTAERRRAVGRVHRALGWSPGECERLVLACAATMGECLADALRLEVCSGDDLRRMIRLEELEYLRDALASGNGALILSAHTGNWEVLAAALAHEGIPLSVVARRPDDPAFAERLDRLRRRWGVESLWRDRGPRPVLRALANGRAVGILLDQAAGDSGACASFFGYPAFTPVAPAKLAIRRGVPVVPVHCATKADGTYTGVIEPATYYAPDADPVEVTAEWTAHIERWIRRQPQAWVWMHDRWRMMPDRTAIRCERRGVAV